MLHHGTCFDGAASSAIFCAFARAHLGDHVQLDFRPKDHRPGNPFDPQDFDADEVAVLDFRYTPDPRLTWFFDHHVSSFQLAGEREHFERNRRPTLFYDPSVKSCARLVAQSLHRTHGFDVSAFKDLLLWADLIDSAAFDSPQAAIELSEPALRIMTFVENNREPDQVRTFITDLGHVPLERLAGASYVRQVVDPIVDRHRSDIALLGERCRARAGIVEFELLDQPGRAYNKFIPYYHHPSARYVVGLLTGPDGRIRLTVGYNPWLPKDQREHDVAALCERFAGGGHPYVGGATFAPDDAERARQARDFVSAVLRGAAA